MLKQRTAKDCLWRKIPHSLPPLLYLPLSSLSCIIFFRPPFYLPSVPGSLVDGVNRTCDAHHMWLTIFRYEEEGGTTLTVDLGSSMPVSSLRVWNYNTSQEDSYFGVWPGQGCVLVSFRSWLRLLFCYMLHTIVVHSHVCWLLSRHLVVVFKRIARHVCSFVAFFDCFSAFCVSLSFHPVYFISG